jgi:hypothetical protein
MAGDTAVDAVFFDLYGTLLVYGDMSVTLRDRRGAAILPGRTRGGRVRLARRSGATCA